MRKIHELGLLAIGLLAALVPATAHASPLTEPTFATFFSQNDTVGGWRRSTGYLRTFVHWDSDAPAWNQRNIAWVKAWSSGDVWVLPGIPGDTQIAYVPPRNPPWEHEVDNVAMDGDFSGGDQSYGNGGVTMIAVPEPGSAALAGTFVGALVLRRRVKA